MLLNRTMLHQCREGYCLNAKQKPKKQQTDPRVKCRFGFEKDYHGFVPIWDVNGSSLVSCDRNEEECSEGVEIGGGDKPDLLLMRNHPRMVSHIPELLSIWQANIEGRPVRSYEQVIRYLLNSPLESLMIFRSRSRSRPK